jgi:hypothetical protein
VNFQGRLALFAAALWWGSLTAIGFLAVPLLFANAPSPALAGQLAAKLFAGQTWLSLGCGVLLLALSREQGMGWARGALAFVIAGLLVALLAQFAVAPRIVARENLALWHGLGSAMYLTQWGCAGAVLWKLSRASAS